MNLMLKSFKVEPEEFLLKLEEELPKEHIISVDFYNDHMCMSFRMRLIWLESQIKKRSW
jgi:hypothetical protein